MKDGIHHRHLAPEPAFLLFDTRPTVDTLAGIRAMELTRQIPAGTIQSGSNFELLIQYGAGLSNMAGFTTWTPDLHGSKETCPVLDDPEPDCYCLKLTSLNIPRAVHYCLRDFRDCPIYRRFMEIDDF